jgi:hypothetical protein
LPASTIIATSIAVNAFDDEPMANMVCSSTGSFLPSVRVP